METSATGAVAAAWSDKNGTSNSSLISYKIKAHIVFYD